MSGDRPRFIWMPTSFSQGVARTDSKTWGVLTILLVVAIGVVLVLNLTVEKKPMFGNAPFGQGQRQQQERREAIPVVPAHPAPLPH
jgi:hypothetical protein